MQLQSQSVNLQHVASAHLLVDTDLFLAAAATIGTPPAAPPAAAPAAAVIVMPAPTAHQDGHVSFLKPNHPSAHRWNE